MQKFLATQPQVETVFRLVTLQLGTSLMVAVKAKMRARTARELVATINRVERRRAPNFPNPVALLRADVTD